MAQYKKYNYHSGEFVYSLPEDTIFVFGSNLAGRHGAGAALIARNHFGAKYGNGIGMQGQSYAIPTKDKELNVLSLSEIAHYITQFINHAENTPHLKYFITEIGCGYAGYYTIDIAPFLKDVPPNCLLSPQFKPILEATND